VRGVYVCVQGCLGVGECVCCSIFDVVSACTIWGIWGRKIGSQLYINNRQECSHVACWHSSSYVLCMCIGSVHMKAESQLCINNRQECSHVACWHYSSYVRV